jgi:uncharacterized protein YecE (DUF72 family)
MGRWGDDAYVGVLYRPGVPKAERLGEYARSLEHVEVNSTYYAIPQPSAIETWLRLTPPEFTFSVKLHRAFSQSPAKAAAGDVRPKRWTDAMQPLLKAKRLACYLLVLPPSFTPDRRQLADLLPLAELLAPVPLAVELRDRAWIEGRQKESTLDFFRAHRLTLVGVDLPKVAGSRLMPAVDEVTNPGLAYVRLHGRNAKYAETGSTAEGHAHLYTARELASIVTRVKRLAKKAGEVFVIANNHAQDFAPRTALALRQRLEA